MRRTQRRQPRSRASASSVASRATSPAYARATSLGSKMASVRTAGKVLRNSISSSQIKLRLSRRLPHRALRLHPRLQEPARLTRRERTGRTVKLSRGRCGGHRCTGLSTWEARIKCHSSVRRRQAAAGAARHPRTLLGMHSLCTSRRHPARLAHFLRECASDWMGPSPWWLRTQTATWPIHHFLIRLLKATEVVWPSRLREGTFGTTLNHLRQGATSFSCKLQRRAICPTPAGGPMASSLQDFSPQRLIILVEGTHV